MIVDYFIIISVYNLILTYWPTSIRNIAKVINSIIW